MRKIGYGARSKLRDEALLACYSASESGLFILLLITQAQPPRNARLNSTKDGRRTRGESPMLEEWSVRIILMQF